MAFITIKSDVLTAVVNTLGAELTSVKNKDGYEYIWQGSEAWKDHAPVLFPIVSGLRDDKYTLDGKEYHMEPHGFASQFEFETEEVLTDSATFLLRSNEATKKQYPFDFEFRVRFTLTGNKLCQEHITDNKSACDMYYSAGSHEGYRTPGGLDNYSLVFDEPESAKRYANVYDENGMMRKETIPYLENEREIKLCADMFDVEELDLIDFKSKGVALRDDRTGRCIHVSFPDADTLVFWSKKGARAEYICIEPWCGTWDFPEYTPCDFSEKFRIRTLAPGTRETLTHTITF